MQNVISTYFLFLLLFLFSFFSSSSYAKINNINVSPQVELTFTVDEINELAFIAHITIYNKATVPLKNWLLGFTFQRMIEKIQGAHITKQIGDYYVLAPDMLNKIILPNHAAVFTIRGQYTIRNIDDVPAGYFLIVENNKARYNPIIIESPKTELLEWKPARGFVPGIDDYSQNILNNLTAIEENPVDSIYPMNVSLIVPMPVSVELGQGVFNLNANTVILFDSETAIKTAYFLKKILQPATGYDLTVKRYQEKYSGSNNIILLTTNSPSPDLKQEGYQLTVTSKHVIIQANTDAGLFYGVQSLRQLFSPKIFDKKIQKNIQWNISAITIKDYPRFAYRGVLLDVARHFFSLAEIKRLLDLMAIHKLNILHWHLTDDEGWRIQIKHYPQLTSIGAWRGYNEILPPALGSGPTKNGGYYTQDEVRELINYGKERHIIIIPEIDIPGHSRAMIQSLPKLLIDPLDKTSYSSIRGFHDNVISPCINTTYEVLNNIMEEIANLFPSYYVHVGADERAKDAWKHSPNCIALMRKLKLINTEQLQNYFMNKIQIMLAAKNKSIGAWEEVMQGGSLQKKPMPLIYSWTGIKAGVNAAKQGFDVIMSPAQYLYLELAYSADPLEIGDYWGGYLNTFKIYSYQPTAHFTENFVKRIKGIEGALWSEYINSAQRLDYFAFPKLAAVAEVAWTPPDKRNWKNFSRRMSGLHLPRLDHYNVFYRLSPPGINYIEDRLNANNEFSGSLMRYSLNNSMPSLLSTEYKQPVKVSAKIIRMRTFNTNGRGSSEVSISTIAK